VKERKAKNASLAWTQKYQKIEIKEKKHRNSNTNLKCYCGDGTLL